MEKVDRRRKSPAEKEQSAATRVARDATKRRVAEWTAAAEAAEAAGYPINVALHITWSALAGGECRPGHCLGLAAPKREVRIWSGMRQVAARAKVPWLAARAPEYDRKRGLHLHTMLHLPDEAALRDAVRQIEKLTGAPAEWIDPAGRSVRSAGRTTHGVVARSACGGWLLQRNVAALGASIGIAAYAAKGDGKAHVEGQHRLSNALSALARSAAAAGGEGGRARQRRDGRDDRPPPPCGGPDAGASRAGSTAARADAQRVAIPGEVACERDDAPAPQSDAWRKPRAREC